MPLTINAAHIALRLALTVIAGLIIGIDRGERGRAAGMRTTLLVCLAASLSMILANRLMNTTGKSPTSFVVLDLMRLPLGILSGIGFIGAGAIIRKGDSLHGVTTAATLWFSTVMGLCFGAGEIGVGIAALGLGWGTLWGLKKVERLIRQDLRASMILRMDQPGLPDEDIRRRIELSGRVIVAWAVEYLDHGRQREIHCDMKWHVRPERNDAPEFVAQLAAEPGVASLRWTPSELSYAAAEAASRPRQFL